MDTTAPIDTDFSAPLFDDADDTPLPSRSPSRLDFCIDDLDNGDGDGIESRGLDWDETSHDLCPYTLIEDTFPVDIAPPDRPRVEVPKGFMAKPLQDEENDDMEEVLIEPRAPIPVRPPPVQHQVEAQEYTPFHNTTQRLNYPHHGFSRSALLQQKNFWSSRHGEWAEWQSYTMQKQESTTNDAYTGLDTDQPPTEEYLPPYMRIPSGLERDLPDHPRKHEPDVHAPIYPRSGDISALRDPYSVNIDRCFSKFPVWTLHKMLYMSNMYYYQGSTLSVSVSAFNTSPIKSSNSSSTLSSYSSSSSGEDDESDDTLVADDSKHRLLLEPSVGHLHQVLSPAKCAAPLPCLPSSNHFWGWSWYARWEVLLGLFQRDITKCDALDMSGMKLAAPYQSKATPPSPPAPIFRIDVEGEDDDDDDDYGTVISTSTFDVDLEMECERAIAFCSRESKRAARAEVVL